MISSTSGTPLPLPCQGSTVILVKNFEWIFIDMKSNDIYSPNEGSFVRSRCIR
ncbi:hypothetical protein SLEP1_g59134 [Rubroshorea leprosula]|uniref:Uncharacterized protein n=1 Tax=Rubroshorea leprosula TaxID=152421 RepID=A0AAV5MW02_9ROSI|nr:hypothetical protein SLEP1_g59134 [Rubroshorea leprosula]